MTAQVICLRNPLNQSQRTITTISRRRKISSLAPRTSQPVIAYYNGRVILRREWHRKTKNGDVVAFVILPRGGGDGEKNPLQIIAMIAIMVVAPQVGLMAGAAGTFANMAAQAAFSFVANSLVSAAFGGKPSAPTPQVQASIASPSPTYTLGAQGNTARLEQVIPDQYGRMQAYPDFAAQPYAEFSGNEQFVYQLLCLGQGYYDIEAIRIEDTPISSFEEITYEIIEPGASLTLFPSNVVTATEVSGQLAEYDTWLGGFIANASGSTANAIAVDMVCPRGVYYANDSGGLSTVSIAFTVEARTVDSGGAPTGSWVTLGSETISAATSTPQRFSYRYTGLSGRYEVRLKRTSTAGGTSRYADDLNWVGLRAYLPETRVWPGKTLIAMRMRASNNLSNQASRKVNIISTRKLPIWDGSGWTSPQVTRSPSWAMANILRAEYGGKMPNSRINIDQLVSLAATYAARGDTFDGRFDNTVTLWEALSKVGQAVRTRPYQQGGIIQFARDEAVSIPTAMFSMQNIIRGSFSVDYLMPTDETADKLDVAYFDEDVWSQRRVGAALPGSASAVPLKIDLFGVVQRQQAYQEGMYLAAVNKYRRKQIKFATEMEGFIPGYGDLITVSHDMPAWGISGEVVAVEEYDGVPISSWTPAAVSSASGGVGPDGENDAITFTESSAVTWGRVYAGGAVVSGLTYTKDYWIKKDADSSRFILMRLYSWLAAGGGTPGYVDCNFRTHNGEFSVNAFGGATAGSATVESWDDDWWHVRVSCTVANGNDYMQWDVYPAVGTTWMAQVASATGSATVWTGPITRLTLSEPVEFSSGTHYIGLRTRNGGVSGPYACIQGRNAREVVIAGLLDETPYTGGAAERTYFAFGLGETWRQPARVMSIKPRNMYEVEITAINEDASVHTADEGVTAPAAQYSLLPSLYTSPIVSGLTVRSKLGDPSIALCSWRSAPGARFYVVDVSNDGDTWSRVSEPTTNNAAVSAIYGAATIIRVAAFGFTLGPFIQIAYETVSDYMWSPVDTTLMWAASDSTLMWST